MLRTSQWVCALVLAVGCRTSGADGQAGTGGTDTGDPDGDADSGGSDDAMEFEPTSVAEPLAARLTDTQLRYSILDVLGVALTDEELTALPRDIPTGRDYSTTTVTQSFGAQYVLAYAEIARAVSATLDPTVLVAEHGGCAALAPACRPAFVQSLGRLVFRRPLTDEESARYVDLAETIAARAETTEQDAVRGIVQALLQAPQFLYRLEHEIEGEPGQVRPVDGYELASRLSYFLWQSAPDSELLTFAAGPEGDGVFDPGALLAQVERMIADDKFARSRALFWGDYTMAARSSFGTPDAALAQELRDSLLATLQDISADNPQPLSALFDGERMVMTPAVATLAGAASLGPGLQVYDVGQAQERLGVVTHPAFLAAMSTTSFVGRGLQLTERLLCQFVAEPPTDIAEEIEQTAQTTQDMTPREASEFRFTLEPVCLGCHTQFEPIAYGFERYDILGRYTTTDANGRELYSDGVLPVFGERPQITFSDAPELLAALAELPSTHSCLVRNMTEFATGQPVHGLGDFVPWATQEFADAGLGYDALARSVAASEQRTLTRVVAP